MSEEVASQANVWYSTGRENEVVRMISDGVFERSYLPYLTEGRLEQRGMQIINSLNGRIVRNLVGDSRYMFVSFSPDVYLLDTPARATDYNQDLGPGFSMSSTTRYNVLAANGDAVTMEVGRAPLAARGSYLMVREEARGKLSYISVPVESVDPDARSRYEAMGYELASLDEAEQRALRGYMMKAGREGIDELAAKGFDINGEVSNDPYQIAVAIIGENIDEVQLWSERVIDFRPSE